MRIRKVKRPGGNLDYEVEVLGEDQFGPWLAARKGGAWWAPHAAGVLPVDAVILLPVDESWVGWWIDDPAGRRLAVDVAQSAQRDEDGWAYVDLELDAVRHEPDEIELQDEDEFEAASRSGAIGPEDQAMARAAATRVMDMLERRQEPLGDVGWETLDALRT